jgi:oligopeptide/dipeptide ABC transporter ATP-binding protein
VVRHFASHVGVLYAGRLVETGPAAEVFARSRHPYTRMLLAATPSLAGDRRARDEPVSGEPPSPFVRLAGCPFVSRCSHATERCGTEKPTLNTFADGLQRAACWHSASLPRHDVMADDEALMSAKYRRRMALLRAARGEGHG